jgi:hypothetical protein
VETDLVLGSLNIAGLNEPQFRSLVDVLLTLVSRAGGSEYATSEGAHGLTDDLLEQGGGPRLAREAEVLEVVGKDGWYLTMSDYAETVSCLLDAVQWDSLEAAVAELAPELEWDTAGTSERPAGILLPDDSV